MKAVRSCCRLALLMLCAFPVCGMPATGTHGLFQWYGDLRLRLEHDWDSQDAAGTPREDRDRLRGRARLGVNVRPDEHLLFGARLRTGSRNSQQSPHITLLDFSGNDTGPSDANADKWFARAQTDRLWAWAGRNSIPFWQQNELFLDEDATPRGVAAGGTFGDFAVNAGYLSPPVGTRAFVGTLVTLQGVYTTQVGDTGLTAALGRLSFNADPSDPDAARLRSGNGTRDYILWTGSVQARFAVAGRPLTLGADVVHNSEQYAATLPDRDQRDGYVASAIYGDVEAPGDWLAGYYYAYLEKYAVNASYAQDDWTRWGSVTQTDSSDFKGHELRAGYAFTKDFNALARLFLVDAISSIQDGKRFRVDFNYRF